MQQLTDIPQVQKVRMQAKQTTHEQSCDGRNGSAWFSRCLAVKRASCDSPCIELATYKLSLRDES